MFAEQVHRYPRWMTVIIELLCAVLVAVAALVAGRMALLYLWATQGLDLSLSERLPWLTTLVVALGGGVTGERVDRLSMLLPSLVWLMLALLLALIARNSFPTIRTSPRGMLVEFSNGWLPIPWESVMAIKVTEDFGAERFVLLAETSSEQLTGWHRFYSFMYRFGFRRGFLITSGISNFDGLVKTLLAETDRVANVLDKVTTVKLQEDASSPLFRFLLGPASFFSRRDSAEAVEAEATVPQSQPAVPQSQPSVMTSGAAPATSIIQGVYPRRISALFNYGTAFLAVAVVVRYVVYWLEFLAIQFPSLRNMPVFDRLSLTTAQAAAPWWLLVAAHLMVLVMLGLLVAIRHVLPELRASAEGLGVRYFNLWFVVPWERIQNIKVTELSENSQLVLIQSSGGLPASSRLASLLYDGTPRTGVLLTSAISGYERILQRTVIEVTRYHNLEGEIESSPIFQSATYSPLLFTSLRAASSIDRQVEDARENDETARLSMPRLLQVASPMFWIALMPALLVIADRVIRQGVLPTPFVVLSAVLFLVLGLLEWLVVALAAAAYDDMSGGGEEGNRAFYLYPTTQLPRVLPLSLAIIATLIGIPALALVLWIVAIGWSFLLAAGLWSELYDWRGSQLVVGGLVPVIFQLLMVLAYLFVQ